MEIVPPFCATEDLIYLNGVVYLRSERFDCESDISDIFLESFMNLMSLN